MAGDAVLRTVRNQPAVTATVKGFKAFPVNPERPGDGRPFVALLDSPGLEGMHHAVMMELRMKGLESSSKFIGANYKPHMTVGYLDDGEYVPDYSQWIGTKINFTYGHMNTGTGDDQHWGLISPKTLAGLTTMEKKYNDKPLDRSPKENWVEERGGLPPFVRAVARALMRDHGYTMSRAIATAINKMKDWARGGDHVTAKTKAKAAAALAQWEAAKATKSISDLVFDMIFETKGKESGMLLEHKSISAPLTVDDEENGILTAFVSVTGVRDNVGDIIKPGAYAKSLRTRTPKGLVGHSWEKAVSKALDVKELMPGDPELPAEWAGNPWPAEAGALRVKVQYNMMTEAGRDAFHTAKFYGDDQEWSVGFNVPAGTAEKKANGTRFLNEMDLYEYSQVLWGANSMARSVPASAKKEAERVLCEIKSMFPDDFKEMAGMDEDDPDADDAEMNGEEEETGKRRHPRRTKALPAELDFDSLVGAYQSLGAFLGSFVPGEEEKDLFQTIDELALAEFSNRKSLLMCATLFEQDGYSVKSAIPFLESIRDAMDTEEDEDAIEGLKSLATDVRDTIIEDGELDDIELDDDYDSLLDPDEFDDGDIETDSAEDTPEGKTLAADLEELKAFAATLEVK